MDTVERTLRTEGLQPPCSDEDLWAEVQAGKPGSFEEVHKRFEPIALRVAASVCGSDAAEDSVQAAFLSIWRGRNNFDPSQGSLRGWILTAVRRRAIDTLRQYSRPFHRVANEPSRELADPRLTEVEVASRETSAEVRKAVAQLPPAQRQVIELAYFREFSQAEIASTLQVPLGTVKGRNRLASKKLLDNFGIHQQNVLKAS